MVHAGVATELLVLLADFPPAAAVGTSVLHPAPRRCARAPAHHATVCHARLAPMKTIRGLEEEDD